jgi:mannose-6-phosphate isomerase
MLSLHKDGMNIVLNGEYSSKPLNEVLEIWGKSALGKNAEKFSYFPILIKLIDAKQKLSVQVHPDDKYALSVEGEYGKTEMWYVVDCDEGAELIYGFKEDISKEEFESRIKDNTLTEVCNFVPVNKGDVFFIEAGTLHAIGEGILIAEVQQNSNSTYRVYDYGRVGADGKPRQLHVEKAVEVTELCPPKYDTKPEGSAEKIDGGEKTLLRSCEYFNVNKIKVESEVKLSATEKSFNSILVLDGKGEINGQEAGKGDSFFIPASFGEYKISGDLEIIVTDII